MIASESRRGRRGATMVEAAAVVSVLMMLMVGLIVMAVGTARYQQVAGLAREAARYASVHGAYYKRDSGNSMATPASVYNNAILRNPSTNALRGTLDPARISYSVTWDNANEGPVYLSNAATNTYKINYVSVTVTYQWQSQAFPGFASTTRTLTSTSRMPVTY